jgi:hypothetical protein
MPAAMSQRVGAFGARALLVWAAACGVAARAAAQGSDPLRKTDVVRLLSSPVMDRKEIADLIRRNCLAFRPTERDWADFRSLGADAGVLGSVGACAGRFRSLEPEPEPRAALSVVPLPARVVAAPESDAVIRVLVKRGNLVQGGVGLVLRGTSALAPTGAREAEALTDQNGLAQFRVRAGRVAGTYPLRVALKGGVTSPNDPLVELVVPPASPAMADVGPTRLSLDSADVRSVSVVVVVKDVFGNPVPGQPVELRGIDPEMGLAAGPTPTDSNGWATLVLKPRTIRRTGRIDVRVHGNRLASLDAVFTDAVSSAVSRFVTGAEQAGIARTQLNAPLVFLARGISGRPLPGRVISFTAHNAEVNPDHAITDGAGLAQVQVTLGPKAGTAIVIAAVDSVRTQATLHVQAAAPATVIIEHQRVRADGGHLVVVDETPFALDVSARDAYGNPVPVAGLAGVLERMRTQFNTGSSLLRMESVRADTWVTTVTFKPLRRGTAPLTIADATVTVEVVGRGRLPR